MNIVILFHFSHSHTRKKYPTWDAWDGFGVIFEVVISGSKRSNEHAPSSLTSYLSSIPALLLTFHHPAPFPYILREFFLSPSITSAYPTSVFHLPAPCHSPVHPSPSIFPSPSTPYISCRSPIFIIFKATKLQYRFQQFSSVFLAYTFGARKFSLYARSFAPLLLSQC